MSEEIDVNMRKRKGLFAVVSGILMLIIGAHGSAGSLVEILVSVTEEGLIPKAISFMVGSVLIVLAVLGGITVIAGGLLLYSKVQSFLSKFLISLGSGVSMFNLFLSIIITSPALQPLLIAKQINGILNIGIIYVMYFFAALFALYALVDDIYGLVLGIISGTLISISQSIAPLMMTLDFLRRIGVVHPSPIVVTILAYLFLSGVFFYIAGFLYSYKQYKLGFAVLVIGFIMLVVPLLSILIGFIFEAVRILQVVFMLSGIIVGIVALHYGYTHI